MTVACEPAGPQWLQVQQLCAGRGCRWCIQPLVSHIVREQQDCTSHKTDEADCVMIARPAAGLHNYPLEQLDQTLAHLRHLGRRRNQLITASRASQRKDVSISGRCRVGDMSEFAINWAPIVSYLRHRHHRHDRQGSPGQGTGLCVRTKAPLVMSSVSGSVVQRVDCVLVPVAVVR